jgi:8-amino-7-oxononanoate synthase
MFENKLNLLKKQHNLRVEKTIQKVSATEIIINNKQLVNFCSNDYLSLSNNQELQQTYKNAIDEFGLSSSSSHLISGHTKAHQELEEYLQDYLQQKKVLLFSTGYMANLGFFSALKDDIDFILQDKLNHASLIDGNFLIDKPIQRYKHNDLNSLEQKLAKQKGFGVVVTDNVFSMDGDVADITGINNLVQQRKNTLLFQDDAHGFGIYHPTIPQGSIYMATFGKAIGLNGACIAGSKDFIDYLRQKSRPYIYTTALPPATAKTVIGSLEIIKTGERQEKLFNNITLFKQYIKTNSNTAIQPIVIGNNQKALEIEKYLFDNGIYAKAIRPPTVPQAILRITLNAEHTKEQIIKLCNALTTIKI